MSWRVCIIWELFALSNVRQHLPSPICFRQAIPTKACTHQRWLVVTGKVTSSSTNGRKHQHRPLIIKQMTWANDKTHQLDDIDNRLQHRLFPMHMAKFTSSADLSHRAWLMHISNWSSSLTYPYCPWRVKNRITDMKCGLTTFAVSFTLLN